MYSHSHQRGIPRIPELLESLKVEFETTTQDANMYKARSEEFERKLQAQLTEMNTIKQQLFDIERSVQTMKSQYEEEILRLRRQLDTTGHTHTPPNEPRIGSAFTLPNLNAIPPFDKNPHRRMDLETSESNGNKPFVPPINVSNSNIVGGNLHGSNSNINNKQSKSFTNTNESESKEGKKQRISIGDGKDWVVGINHEVESEKKLDIDLNFDLNHDSVVCCVKFSSDGKYLATGCIQKAQIFDVYTGKKLNEFVDTNASGENFYIRSVVFDPSGRYLATGAEDRTIKIWDIASKSLHNTLRGHGLDIYSLDYSKDGRLLVSGSGDRTVKIWDASLGKCIGTLGTNEIIDGVTSVAFSPDGTKVAAGSLDKEVRVWDIEKQQIIEKYHGHKDAVYSVAFDPFGKSLVSGSLDKKLKLWDLNSRSKSKNHQTFSGHKDYVLSVAFSPDGQWLVSGSKDRYVHFWDPRTVSLHMMLHGHQNSVISVSLTGNDKVGEGKFATGSGDNKARLWSFKNSVR